MADKFIPDVGTLFYREGNGILKSKESVVLKGEVVELEKADFANSNPYINKCIARDDYAIVSTIVATVNSSDSGLIGQKYIYFINKHIFRPVGPEVAAALGLTEKAVSAEDNVISDASKEAIHKLM